MRFELPATRTLEFTGNRTVPILSYGGDKQSFTVVLAVKADIQRRSSAANRGAQENAGFCTQEGLDERRRFVIFPLSFSEYLIVAMTILWNNL